MRQEAAALGRLAKYRTVMRRKQRGRGRWHHRGHIARLARRHHARASGDIEQHLSSVRYLAASSYPALHCACDLPAVRRTTKALSGKHLLLRISVNIGGLAKNARNRCPCMGIDEAGVWPCCHPAAARLKAPTLAVIGPRFSAISMTMRLAAWEKPAPAPLAPAISCAR